MAGEYADEREGRGTGEWAGGGGLMLKMESESYEQVLKRLGIHSTEPFIQSADTSIYKKENPPVLKVKVQGYDIVEFLTRSGEPGVQVFNSRAPSGDLNPSVVKYDYTKGGLVGYPKDAPLPVELVIDKFYSLLSSIRYAGGKC